MNVRGIDHLVLSVADVERSVDRYTDVLSASAKTFDGASETAA